MKHERINAYRIMWLIVLFDLPVTTPTLRKKAQRFRKDLLNDGFSMMQFSVYLRHCASRESAEVHIGRIADFLPAEGHVSIIRITDKQFSQIINFWGAKTDPLPPAPLQLELF